LWIFIYAVLHNTGLKDGWTLWEMEEIWTYTCNVIICTILL